MMSNNQFEPHPRFKSEFLLSEIFRVIDFDYAVAYLSTLQQAAMAMAETGVSNEKAVFHIEKLRSFFMAVHHEELNVYPEVQKMLGESIQDTKSLPEMEENAVFQFDNVSGWMGVKKYEPALIKARCLVEALEELVNASKG